MTTNSRTVQEITTTLSGDEVLARARAFFSNRPSLYATFIDKDGPGFVTFRGQGGEEIVIAVANGERGTRVTGSSYLFDMQVARFFTTIAPEAVESLPVPAPASGAAS